MTRFNTLAAVLLAASLAACSQTRVADTPPVSANSSASSQMPQPANSLPEGAAVNAPLNGQTGVVSETQVAPTRASAHRPSRRARRHVTRVRQRQAAPSPAPGASAPQ